MKEAQNLTIFGNEPGSELLAQGMPQVDVIRIISGVIRIISGQRHDGGLVGGAVAVRGREA